MTSQQTHAFVLRGEPTLVWRPTVLYTAIGTAIGGSVVFSSLDVTGSTREAIADFLRLSLFLGGVLVAITVPAWWWIAGRTSYAVDPGRFHVLVGRRIVGSWDLSGMRAFSLEGGPAWIDLLTPLNTGGGLFPKATFLSDAKRVSCRSIMLWGRSTDSAERALLAAIAANR